MCRNIKTLHNFEPPATPDEVSAAALQYVRKVSGTTKPSKANEAAFARAVAEVAEVTNRLLATLVTAAPPRDREVEAARARARAEKRFGTPQRRRDRPAMPVQRAAYGYARASRSPDAIAAEVGEVRLGVDRAAHRALDRLGRRELAAQRVDGLAEPRVQLGEVPALDLLVDRGDLRAEPIPDLDREHGPEEVRREVPEPAARPVRILQDAVCVVRDRDAHELLEARVPGVGQVLHREATGDELLLELEAEDDVEPVAHLVGVDADERPAHAVHRPVEVLERHRAELTQGTTPAGGGRTSARRGASAR